MGSTNDLVHLTAIEALVLLFNGSSHTVENRTQFITLITPKLYLSVQCQRQDIQRPLLQLFSSIVSSNRQSFTRNRRISGVDEKPSSGSAFTFTSMTLQALEIGLKKSHSTTVYHDWLEFLAFNTYIFEKQHSRFILLILDTLHHQLQSSFGENDTQRSDGMQRTYLNEADVIILLKTIEACSTSLRSLSNDFTSSELSSKDNETVNEPVGLLGLVSGVFSSEVSNKEELRLITV